LRQTFPAGRQAVASTGKTRREKTVPDTEFVVVTTTIDNEGAARELARSAVTARLAACGQVGSPVTSVYWWDHAVRELTEWTVSLKTTRTRYAALAEHIRAVHTYEVPEIVATPITGDPAYLAWIRDETNTV
jgi:periplasmic divalent cation tolerance protein